MDTVTLVVVATFIGFCTLAFALLFPVYRFLNREEEISKHWTKEELARRAREHPPANGQERPASESPASSSEKDQTPPQR